MLDESDHITIVCPNCGKEMTETIGRLKEVATLRHETCGAYIHTDINEVIEFARKEQRNTLAKLRLRLNPP
jgi:transcription elongation factor Elf1